MTVEVAPTITADPPVVPTEVIATDPPGTGDTPPPAVVVDDPATKPRPWFETRIGQLTADKHALEARIRELQETHTPKPAATDPTSPPPPPATERTYTEAETRVLIDAEARRQAVLNEFNSKCNDIHAKGVDAFPDFKDVLAGYSKIGGLHPDLVQAALETDEPHKVIYELGKDLDRAASLGALSPIRMAAAVAKFAVSLDKPGAVSKAPPPIKPLGGSAKPEEDPEKMTTEQWMKWREKSRASH